MGRDDQPKERQRRQLERKTGRRPGFDRLLIVSEGSRTEPGYFREIITHHRLPSAHVVVSPSLLGTDPLQVVDYARDLFVRGDLADDTEPYTALFDLVECLVNLRG